MAFLDEVQLKRQQCKKSICCIQYIFTVGSPRIAFSFTHFSRDIVNLIIIIFIIERADTSNVPYPLCLTTEILQHFILKPEGMKSKLFLNLFNWELTYCTMIFVNGQSTSLPTGRAANRSLGQWLVAIPLVDNPLIKLNHCFGFQQVSL